jgi:exonuclease III
MKSQQIKIATWNLNRPTLSTQPRNDSILIILRKIDADILILTETNSCIDLSDTYQTYFSTTCLFQSLALGKEFYKEGENRVTVWSKFRGQRRIDMCNIYGKNRGQYEPKLSKNDFEAAIQAQLTDWERLADLENLCIAGDFNTELSSSGKHYVSASDRGKINECFEKIRVQVPTRDIPNNVDHVAVSASFLKDIYPTWQTWNETRNKSLLSDHMGVSITLQRP